MACWVEGGSSVGAGVRVPLRAEVSWTSSGITCCFPLADPSYDPASCCPCDFNSFALKRVLDELINCTVTLLLPPPLVLIAIYFFKVPPAVTIKNL